MSDWLGRAKGWLGLSALLLGTGSFGYGVFGYVAGHPPAELAAWAVAAVVLALVWRAMGRDEPASVERDRLMRHAMRVETVGDLSSMVAHQLRNRLQIMSGHAALAATEDSDQKDARFATIRNEISGSIELLDQLLELVHPDEGAAQRVELAQLCADFCESARTILPAAIDFEVSLPSEPIEVELEPGGLEHALLNLVINARHAIGDSGSVRVCLARRNGAAQIEVSDTGQGIAAEDLPRVFEPYFTTKPRGKGTGLGLAAVRGFMHASSGEVEVESVVGRGTTFRLEFPLATDSELDRPAQPLG